ncbi:MAG: GDP-mannose-dependent alpha-mannosyltransferase [Anaerolineae bacterium]|nr:GDP-mannose-dependent alpha-mannosyltransferase [Anaerolineae bacterium]
MKIFLAGQAYYRRDNGQAVFTINLAEGLAANGHRVVVLAPSETQKAERHLDHGVKIQAVPAIPLVDNTNITVFSGGLIEQILDEVQPDVIHIQDHYFLSHSVLAAARARRIPIVGTNHFLPENITDNFLHHFPFSQWAHKPLDHLLWVSMLSVYNQLAAVSTPTETAASILRGQGIHVPVSAISCGVDVKRFRPRPTLNRRMIRQKYGLALDRVVMLYVGRLDREKDLDILVDAMAQFGRRDIQLAIVGKGSFRNELERLREKFGLHDTIVLPGFVPDNDLPLLFNSADLFVMPGHAELQSIATLEAMASGLPILAARARALPELVIHGVNGYLFTVRDSISAACGIRQLIQQRAQWPQMGAVSRAKAEAHDHQKVVAQYVEWYRQLRRN